MTSYRVFELATSEGEEPERWQVHGIQEASSANQAIRKMAERLELTEGTFAAVPARSFSPVELTLSQKLTLK